MGVALKAKLDLAGVSEADQAAILALADLQPVKTSSSSSMTLELLPGEPLNPSEAITRAQAAEGATADGTAPHGPRAKRTAKPSNLNTLRAKPRVKQTARVSAATASSSASASTSTAPSAAMATFNAILNQADEDDMEVDAGITPTAAISYMDSVLAAGGDDGEGDADADDMAYANAGDNGDEEEDLDPNDYNGDAGPDDEEDNIDDPDLAEEYNRLKANRGQDEGMYDEDDY